MLMIIARLRGLIYVYVCVLLPAVDHKPCAVR